MRFVERQRKGMCPNYLKWAKLTTDLKSYASRSQKHKEPAPLASAGKRVGNSKHNKRQKLTTASGEEVTCWLCLKNGLTKRMQTHVYEDCFDKDKDNAKEGDVGSNKRQKKMNGKKQGNKNQDNKNQETKNKTEYCANAMINALVDAVANEQQTQTTSEASTR